MYDCDAPQLFIVLSVVIGERVVSCMMVVWDINQDYDLI